MGKRKPWEIPESPWKTEAAFMSFVRGGIRKSLWNRYPIKTIFMKANRVRGINPKTGRECWGGICYLTGEFFPQSELQIDHRSGNHSLKTIEDASDFLKGMLYVDFEDLAFVSKEAHKVKSYAERMGISFEQAVVEKRIINLMKDKKKVDVMLASNELPCNNDEVRKEGLRKLIDEDIL